MQRRVVDVKTTLHHISARIAELGQRIEELQVAGSSEAAGGGTEYVRRTLNPLVCVITYYMVT